MPFRWFTLKAVILSWLVILQWANPIYSEVPTASEDFNWEHYYERLERIQAVNIIPEMVINQLGNSYLGTKGIAYHKNQTQCIEILSYGLNDDIPEIRMESLFTATKGSYSGLVPHLLTRLGVEKDRVVKKLIIWSLGKLGDQNIVLPLTQLLKHETDQELIAFLTLALGRVGGTGDEIRPILYLAENSTNLLVKCAAILGIGRLKIHQAINFLWDLTAYPDKEVRFSAILSLTFLNYDEKKQEPILKDIYNNDSSLYVKLVTAYHQLKRFGYDTYYVQVLCKYLQDFTHRQAVLDFMENLGYPRFIYELQRAITIEKSQLVRLQYSRVIEKIQLRNGNRPTS